MSDSETAPNIREKLSGWSLALDKAPVFLSVLLLFCLPFLTSPRGFDPLLPKKLLLQIVVYGMLLVLCLQSARRSRFLFLKLPAWTPLIFLGVWVLLTVAISPYPVAARAGLADAVLPVLWFVLASLLFREVWRVENLLIAFLAGALGVSLWAVGQSAGWIQGPWSDVVTRTFEGRVVGGLGNPNFLSGYLLTAWPLALALFLMAKSRYARAWWLLTLLSILAALALTGSRSGWLGLFAGSAVFAVFLVPHVPDTWKFARKAAIGFFLLTLLATPWTPGGKRLFHSVDSSDDGWRFRRQVWSGTVELIKDRPWTGSGYGTFEAAFPSKCPQAFALDQVRRAWVVDHAHNAILEWTAETGLVGLLLLAWFWASVMGPWWRLTKGNAVPRPFGASAFACAAGVLVSNLFDVNHATVTTLVPLGLVAALPSALSQRFHHVEGSPVRSGFWDLRKIRWAAWTAVLLTSTLFLNQVYAALKEQNANIRMAMAIEASQAKEYDLAVEGYRGALKDDPGLLEGWYFLGSALLDRNDPGDLSAALEALKTVEAREPDFALLHTKLSLALAQSGQEREARAHLQRAVILDPWLAYDLPDFKKAGELIKSGKPQEALRLTEGLDREFPNSFLILVYRANCMALLKRYDEAVRLLERAGKIKPDSVDVLLNLGYVALARSDWSEARRVLHALQNLHDADSRIQGLAEAVRKAEPR